MGRRMKLKTHLKLFFFYVLKIDCERSTTRERNMFVSARREKKKHVYRVNMFFFSSSALLDCSLQPFRVSRWPWRALKAGSYKLPLKQSGRNVCECGWPSRRSLQKLLVRNKRRWVLTTVELQEEDPGPYPKVISQVITQVWCTFRSKSVKVNEPISALAPGVQRL